MKEYEKCFAELSIREGIILKGERILIPAALRRDILEAAHMGKQGAPQNQYILRRDEVRHMHKIVREHAYV